MRPLLSFALVSLLLAVASGCGEEPPPTNINVVCGNLPAGALVVLSDGTSINCSGDNNTVIVVSSPDDLDGGAGGHTSESEDGLILEPCFWQYNQADPWFAVCAPGLPDKADVESIDVQIDPPDSDWLPAKRPALALVRCHAFTGACETIDIDSDPSSTSAEWRERHWISLTLSTTIDLSVFSYALVFEPYDATDCGPILATRVAID